jgi:hypothetical protein
LKKSLSQKNRTGGVAQGEGPDLKPQYHQKNKKKSCVNNKNVLII